MCGLWLVVFLSALELEPGLFFLVWGVEGRRGFLLLMHSVGVLRSGLRVAGLSVLYWILWIGIGIWVGGLTCFGGYLGRAESNPVRGIIFWHACVG